MATPTMITISGVAETPPGTPDGDFVLEIEQQGYLTHSDGTLIEPTVYRIEAATDGSVSGSVPASTDPAWIYTDPARGIQGTTWSYRVTYWALGSVQRGPFRCTISHLSPGGAITLNSLLPAGTIENTAIYAPVNHTHSGGGGGGAVDSVNGRTGAVVLTRSDVGLSAVDNTSDLAKPISTATATALAGKAATAHTHAQSDVTGLTASLSGKSDVGHSHSPTDVGLSAVANALQLVAANNLSDLTNAGTARTNLGLGNSATRAVGTLSSDVAAGDAPASAVSTHVAASDPHTQYARILTSSGGAYTVSTTAEIYLGPNDPGAVPDGSLWIDTDA